MLNNCQPRCPEHCPIELPECHLLDCHGEPIWEGWARKTDPFTGQPTGMMIWIPVCESHKSILIEAQRGE